jgi:hypothetical protein
MTVFLLDNFGRLGVTNAHQTNQRAPSTPAAFPTPLVDCIVPPSAARVSCGSHRRAQDGPRSNGHQAAVGSSSSSSVSMIDLRTLFDRFSFTSLLMVDCVTPNSFAACRWLTPESTSS